MNTTIMSSITKTHKQYFTTNEPMMMISGYDLQTVDEACVSESWDFRITGQRWGAIGYDVEVTYDKGICHGAGAGGINIDRIDHKKSSFYGGRFSENVISVEDLKKLPEVLVKEMIVAAVCQTVGMCFGMAGWQYDAAEDGYGFERIYGVKLTNTICEFVNLELARIMSK